MNRPSINGARRFASGITAIESPFRGDRKAFQYGPNGLFVPILGIPMDIYIQIAML